MTRYQMTHQLIATRTSEDRKVRQAVNLQVSFRSSQLTLIVPPGATRDIIALGFYTLPAPNVHAGSEMANIIGTQPGEGAQLTKPGKHAL
jgi:hypothetical protein